MGTNVLANEVVRHFSNLTAKDEVQAQVMKATKVSGCLQYVVWNNKYMSKDCKTRIYIYIYKTYIRPILIFAIETRAETTKTKNRLQVAEMKVLRSVS